MSNPTMMYNQLPLLTTITPYWGRPEMLRGFVRSLRHARHARVQHMIIWARNDPKPDWWELEVAGLRIADVEQYDLEPYSIGHYHNLGARRATTDWIMKMDVDTLCNPRFFSELISVLEHTKEKEWFNVGMFMMGDFLTKSVGETVSEQEYLQVLRVVPTERGPEATNFVCRRQLYNDLGGCPPGFAGWGWEDYAQVYMLERAERGADPIPGQINPLTVTSRCRDEISRPKARTLFRSNRWLALLHRYHPRSNDPSYRSSFISERNRKVLLDYITKTRNETKTNIGSVAGH